MPDTSPVPTIDPASGAAGINTAFAGNKYFTAVSDKVNILGLEKLSTPFVRLKKKGSGVVDVLNDMLWSNATVPQEVPQVFVIEKELQFGTWTTNLLSILDQLNNLDPSKNNSVDSIVSLYAAKETGFWYNFPYLIKAGDGIKRIANTWDKANGILDYLNKEAGSGGGKADLTGAVMGAAIGSVTPGFGFEETFQFSNSNTQEITISFPLYNTISQQAAFNHFSFVNLFAFQNLKIRTSFMTYIPPKIYTVDGGSIGGVYMAAAYVSDFKIDSIGTTRRMGDFSSFGPREILIPEAYKVTIVFKDLVSQSSNIFAGSMGGTKIQVTNAGSSPLVQGSKQVITSLVGGVKKYGESAYQKLGGSTKQNNT
jgi:hypothetical protein